jgi:phytoene dehydrogenase-like protein
LRRQFIEFFSEADWLANERMLAEVAQIRDDIAPTWMQEPLSIEATAERFVRPALREHFVKLCRGSVGAYIDRFGFKSNLVKAMYAVTDGFSGLHGTWDTPGTGMNFLVHNMCRLPGADGTWMILRGGMGTVARLVTEKLQAVGGTVRLDARVDRLITQGGSVQGGLFAIGIDEDVGIDRDHSDLSRSRSRTVSVVLCDPDLPLHDRWRRIGVDTARQSLRAELIDLAVRGASPPERQPHEQPRARQRHGR